MWDILEESGREREASEMPVATASWGLPDVRQIFMTTSSIFPNLFPLNPTALMIDTEKNQMSSTSRQVATLDAGSSQTESHGRNDFKSPLRMFENCWYLTGWLKDPESAGSIFTSKSDQCSSPDLDRGNSKLKNMAYGFGSKKYILGWVDGTVVYEQITSVIHRGSNDEPACYYGTIVTRDCQESEDRPFFWDIEYKISEGWGVGKPVLVGGEDLAATKAAQNQNIIFYHWKGWSKPLSLFSFIGNTHSKYTPSYKVHRDECSKMHGWTSCLNLRESHPTSSPLRFRWYTVRFKNQNWPVMRFLYYRLLTTLLRKKQDRQFMWETILIAINNRQAFHDSGTVHAWVDADNVDNIDLTWIVKQMRCLLTTSLV